MCLQLNKPFFSKIHGSIIFHSNFSLRCVHLPWTKFVASNLLFILSINKLKFQLSMAIHLRKQHKKPFRYGLKYKNYDKSECCDFFYVKYTKKSSFFLVAEALTGLIYHCSAGENSSFSSHLA